MLTVLRREEKYILYQEEALHYQKQFAEILMPDAFSEEDGYTVRSLYFDTVDDRDYFDKMTEQNVRRKVRLRIYGLQDRQVKLELKQKENIYQKKRSLIISREHAEALVKGDFSVLLTYADAFAAEMYFILSSEGYRPKTIIEYRRRAFAARENDIRLTFDTDIRATESCFDLFAEDLILHPVFDRNKTVFEVKYNHFMLGYISEIISTINRRKVTSSKYCMGRSIGYPLYR
ncbi:MAG: polyphosphate polymerase domain-containing protein [Bacillota bacterium]|nr:polyphosphate polymerase domain-containing protein [Bacillota bacterium]